MKNIILILSLLFSLTISAYSSRVLRVPAPISYQAGTGSFTVPARMVAVVKVNCVGSETFTIGGTTVLTGSQNYQLSNSTMREYLAGTDSLSVRDNTGSATGDFMFSRELNKTSVTQVFNVTSGVAISGCRYYAEIYKK